jgi:hypothetical protein
MLKSLVNLFRKLLESLKKVFVKPKQLPKPPPCQHYNRTSWRLRKLPNDKSYFYFYCRTCDKVIKKGFK